MERRRFLQLAAGTAAGAVVLHSSALPSSAADVLTLAPSTQPDTMLDMARFRPGGRSTAKPDEMLEMLLEKRTGGIPQWTINGRSYQACDPLFLQQGRRYRLRMMNATGCVHSVHLRHHSFELKRANQVLVSGILGGTIRLERYNVVDADLVLSRPGPVVLQYRQQIGRNQG
jgi:hypothetical protein